ncbi:small multi-drug export protein [Shouchella shacheensis]|uniref:small multi-drug export protein n=1 Tax=Shouchella shacheensis TaxID=1649580 RepID=UPI00073FD637|nr:small multi-drug export protein [Shouchella shacheensis]
MEIFISYIVIFIAGAIPFFEAIYVIPIGAIAGLPIIPVTIFAYLGNLLSVLLMIYFIDRINEWRKNRKKRKGEEVESKKEQRARRLWDKYGMVGMLFIGPFLIGSHLSAFLSVIFGTNEKRVAAVFTFTLLISCMIMAVVSALGVDVIGERTGSEGFLIDFLNNRE